MATQRGRGCAPSAGGKSTSGYDKNRSRTTGLWQKSKTCCIMIKTFASNYPCCISQCSILFRLEVFLCKISGACFVTPDHHNFLLITGIYSFKCPWHQAAARGGGSVCQQSWSADTVPPPVLSATTSPRTRLHGPLLQVWGEEDQWENTESDYREKVLQPFFTHCSQER